MSRRQERVAGLIHQEISRLLQFETSDPRIGFVTVTEVEVTPDLQQATIFITLFSDDASDAAEVMAGLESATPFFRREVAKHLPLRYTPNLRFRIDQSVAYGSKIEQMLSKIDIPSEEEDIDPAEEE